MLNLVGKKALFFDCDGTLADTMLAHKKAYELVFKLHDIPFNSKHFDLYAPQGGDILIKEMIEMHGLSHKTAQCIITEKQKFLPFALKYHMIPNTALLNLISSQYGRRKIVIVSNGRFQSIKSILEELQIYNLITLLVAKEDTVRAKPYPDPYLQALSVMGLDPSEVVVFEDNNIGITSAKAAGIKDVVEVKI